MTKKTEFVAFRCPIDIFEKHIEIVESKKKSKKIISMLKSYDGYKQYDLLFNKISEYFQNGHKSISLNKFIEIVKSIIDYDLIDSINEVIIK